MYQLLGSDCLFESVTGLGCVVCLCLFCCFGSDIAAVLSPDYVWRVCSGVIVCL